MRSNMSEIPRPILKWAGGKRLLLPQLLEHMPIKFDNYFEPFLGGGAFFFILYRLDKIKNAVLADLNPDLILLYKVIQEDANEFIEEFDRTSFVSKKDTFYEIRREFNKRKLAGEKSILQAARLLYLNKTCFNGLYRVNSKGEFNVPFGGYKNPTFFEEENLHAVSNALKIADILCVDFEIAVESASEKSFVYFDPPYAPLSETADFTAYTKAGFSYEQQERLARVFSDLDNRGCSVMESNSATIAIRQLYSNFHLVYVKATRAISADGSKRGKISELLIRNFKTSVESDESVPEQSTLSEFLV